MDRTSKNPHEAAPPGVADSSAHWLTAPSNGRGAIVLDSSNWKILAVDTVAEEFYGISSGNSGHRSLGDILPAQVEQQLKDIAKSFALKSAKKSDFESRVLTTTIVGADGGERSVELRVVPLSGEQLSGEHSDWLLITIHPTTTESEPVQQRDALTGLPDRRELASFFSRVQQAAAGQSFSLAVLFLDLDQFKQINDQHGHTVGDQVLTQLAKRWQDCVRDGDIVVRYGGDEFVVLLTNIRNRSEAEPVIARLTKATSDPIDVGDLQLAVGVTIGIALTDGASTPLDELIAAADRDMYALKKAAE